MKIFAWKLIQQALQTKYEMRKKCLNVDGDCPFCHHEEETIDSKAYMIEDGWNCANPNKSDLSFIDRLSISGNINYGKTKLLIIESYYHCLAVWNL